MKHKILLGVLLISCTVFAQTFNKRIEYVKKAVPLSSTKLKMVVLDENNREESTKTGTIDQLQIPESKRLNLQYDTKINTVKESDVPANLATPLQRPEQWKIVPEILSSKVEGSNIIIDYQIYFTSVKPFKYDQISDTFNGKLGFVLVDISDGSIAKNLSEPAYIEVNSEEIDHINPEKLSVTHLSLPSSEIELSEKNGSDSLKLKIITKNNLSGYDTYIKVEPTLNIRYEGKEIMAFGVEKATIDVRMIGSSSEDSVDVSFSSGSGTFTPDHFSLKNNEVKKIALRSGYKLGDVQISAIAKGKDAENYESNVLTIQYIFPWVFMVFAIAGGIVGSIARYRKKIKFRKILLGIVDGLLACVFYFFLKIPIPEIGELENTGVVVFGVGVLGGLATVTKLFPYLSSLISKEESSGGPSNENQ